MLKGEVPLNMPKSRNLAWLHPLGLGPKGLKLTSVPWGGHQGVAIL